MSDGDNKKILEFVQKERPELVALIQRRLEFGKKKYGHGINLHTDVSKFSSHWDPDFEQMDWKKMWIEELLDGVVYAIAAKLTDPEANFDEAINYTIKALDALI